MTVSDQLTGIDPAGYDYSGHDLTESDGSGNDTIAASATAMSDAGIGIIRVSGPDAVRICAGICTNAKGMHDLETHASNTIVFGYVVDEEGSRTEPGEFTKRAFLGGRIDLSRAEAVMDLISSQNEFARRSALAQLEGSVSEKIREFRSMILYEMAFIESALDDPDSYSLDGYPQHLEEICIKLLGEMNDLLETGEQGAILKEGIRTAIIGRPNAGKSSLLNYLAGTERAIVTEIAGTTRDTLQESVRVRGIQLRLTDTAGIHETQDRVEKIGIERAKSAIGQSELVLYLIDASEGITPEDKSISLLLKQWKNELPAVRKCILLLNKSDLPPVTDEKSVREFFGEADAVLSCSLKTGEGAEELGHIIEKMYHMGELIHQNEVLLTNTRHREEVREACRSVSLVLDSIRLGMSEDFFAIDLMNAYTSLGKIVGEAVEDDLVEEIFSRFCMGK